MTGPVVLLVAVTASSNSVAMTQEAAAACIETIASGARSLVRVVPTLPDDLDLAADTIAAGADAVVVLSWHDADFLTTDVRASVASPGRKGHDGVGHDWIARTVVFSARDLPAERGRTLGLVIASMLEEKWGDKSRGDESARNRRAAASTAPAGPDTPRVETPSKSPALAVSLGASPEAPARWAIEANLTTIMDSAEDIDLDAVGGSFALRRSISDHLALRAGLGFRVTSIDGADATTRAASASVGGAWTSARFGQPRALGFGARVDLIGLHEEVRRESQNSTSPDAQGFWSLGGDLLGQVGYGLSRGTALLMGGGLEETLTEADIVVAGRSIATVPRERVVFELGVLSRF